MTNVIWFVFSLNCRSLWILSSFWLFLDPLSCTYNEIYGWLSVQADAVCERAHGSDLRRCAEDRVSQRRDLLPDHQTNDWKPRQVRLSFTFIARHGFLTMCASVPKLCTVVCAPEVQRCVCVCAGTVRRRAGSCSGCVPVSFLPVTSSYRTSRGFYSPRNIIRWLLTACRDCRKLYGEHTPSPHVYLHVHANIDTLW